MVRAGILLYGCIHIEVDHKKINLYCSGLKTKVSLLNGRDSISYGRKYFVRDEAIIASLPLGYADGYPRKLSNQGEVLLGGKRVSVVGTICMDQFMVDASQVPDVKIGDEVVIIGRQGTECISVEEIAERLNTINYEIICMLSERIPRIYFDEKA